MGWNLDTSIKGGGTGNHIARNWTWVDAAGDVGPGGASRTWAWYGIGVPSGAQRIMVTATASARAGANAAGYYYLYLQTPDSAIHQLANVRFHNNTMWYASWNHTMSGGRAIPHGGTVNVWIDLHNDGGSGTNAYARKAHFKFDWFN